MQYPTYIVKGEPLLGSGALNKLSNLKIHIFSELKAPGPKIPSFTLQKSV